MSEKIRVYEVPVSDISNPNFYVTITDAIATDKGDDIINFMRNRDLQSSWMTTGSTDAANTEILCDVSDSSQIDDIFLSYHNLGDFKFEYWSGSAWVLIDNVTSNTEDFYHYEIVGGVITTQIKLTIYGTIVADEDKRIARLILAKKLESGQFESWPIIEKPTQGTIRKSSVMLSGKYFLSEGIGAFLVTLKWKGVIGQNDIDLIERMFLWRKPFMIWLSGGDQTQFRFKLTGYRNEDMYIMKPRKDYINAYYKGLYRAMVPQTIDLVEVVE